MAQLPEITGLDAISGRYDALFCDVWGVVHNGRAPFARACAALSRWRQERGPVVLVSNSPRPNTEIPAQFAMIGVPPNICDAIVTSGDVTRAALAQRAPGKVFKIGPDRDQPIYAGLDLTDAPLEAADFISCTGLNDEHAEEPESYRPLLEQGARRGLTMVCANPDIVVHVGDRLIPCGGALAQIYAELGGPVVMAGKPYRPIYELACERLAALTGAAPDLSRVLAVGDGAPTDIAGANAFGIDALFIAGGIHRELLGPGGEPEPAAVQAHLAQTGAHTRWAARALFW